MCQAQVPPSSLQEIEYHITVSRILGAWSKNLFARLLEKRLQGCGPCGCCFPVLGVAPRGRGLCGLPSG